MDMLGKLVVSQVVDADIIAISKTDAVDEAAAQDAARRVRNYNERAEIIYISSFTGDGLDQLVDRIHNWKSGS